MKIEEEIEIKGRLGLHARPAAKLAKALNGLKAQVLIGRGEKLVDARSILDVLTLAASAGTRLRIVAEGEEAEKALNEIKRVLEAYA
ncbi:HPr family phosphocarrier protein [Thermosulfurimonas dismutans]|uniref:Phosphotransferase system, phosphocarrier protein HPr n=1 Tax=Thermosulfurimonas dismutans TaxID=999894 RepID=A0A179D4S8_9BACT|nr:HPr family phosphocarrier protein [Thermosulfurimonas dismutans]OAQ21046.1 Phosphotransferase system, phosphocarrier protein HPr [Thermosulfurimonas dismutans]